MKNMRRFYTPSCLQNATVSVRSTVEPGNSKLFEKQQMVYYCQEFTIEEVIYVINGLKSNQKKFTIARLFTIDQFTIARFDCMSNNLIILKNSIFSKYNCF